MCTYEKKTYIHNFVITISQCNVLYLNFVVIMCIFGTI